MRTRAASVSLIGIAIAGACSPLVNGVRIEPSAVPAHPDLIVSDSTGTLASGLVYGLSVVRCGSDSSAWTLTSTGTNSSIGRVRYGVAPPGFASTIGPDSLRAGCYDVFVTNGQPSRFHVDAAGRVVVDREAVPPKSGRPASPGAVPVTPSSAPPDDDPVPPNPESPGAVPVAPRSPAATPG